MAKDSTDATQSAEPKSSARQALRIDLTPSDVTPSPVLANFTVVQPTGGVALIDFGFVEPRALSTVSQLAKAGKKVPERLNARLASRVALPIDSLANLHRQIGALLQAISKEARDRSKDRH